MEVTLWVFSQERLHGTLILRPIHEETALDLLQEIDKCVTQFTSVQSLSHVRLFATA